MKNYLNPKKIILIDRDGVINEKAIRNRYVENWGNFVFKESTLSAMKKLSDLGASFVVLTNQAGINRGMVNFLELKLIHKNMIKEMKNRGINIIDVFICPHRVDENCECRKPKPGMFYKASKKWSIRLDKTVYIGDDPKDMEAAKNAGCWGIYLGSRNQHVSKNPRVKKICNNLNSAIKIIDLILED